MKDALAAVTNSDNVVTFPKPNRQMVPVHHFFNRGGDELKLIFSTLSENEADAFQLGQNELIERYTAEVELD